MVHEVITVGQLSMGKKLQLKTVNTLQNLKESVKLRSPSVDNNLRTRNSGPKRTSAQVVSLFKYDSVSVSNFSLSSSYPRIELQTGNQFRNRRATWYSDGNNRDKVSILMTKGPIEVYQILTPSSSDTSEVQKINYLSIGKNGTIVHPVLPKLQVTKLDNYNYKFCIHFFNPDRVWEIEFLSRMNQEYNELSTVVANFEQVMASICQYTLLDGTESEPTKVADGDHDDSETEDLNYLLNEDSNQDFAENNISDYKLRSDPIKKAFMQVMNQVYPIPTQDSRRYVSDPLNNVTSTCEAGFRGSLCFERRPMDIKYKRLSSLR